MKDPPVWAWALLAAVLVLSALIVGAGLGVWAALEGWGQP